MAIEKIYVRNERLWKVALVYLMISIVLFVVGMGQEICSFRW
jgi:hypothetical protein